MEYSPGEISKLLTPDKDNHPVPDVGTLPDKECVVKIAVPEKYYTGMDKVR